MTQDNSISLLRKSTIMLLFFVFIFSLALGVLTSNSSWFILSFFCSPFVLIFFFGFIEGYLGSKKIDKLKLSLNNMATICFAFLTLLAGILILALQAYNYLKLGAWSWFSVIDVLLYFNNSWSNEPLNWIGLWNILSNTPVIIIFFALSYYLFNIADISDKS